MAKSHPPNTGRRTPKTGSLLSQLLLLTLGILSATTLAAPSPPPPPPVITPPPTLLQIRQDANPQIQALSQQLQSLSQSSRDISQSSQQLSISSAQLLNSVQQLSSRLIQTEQSVNALRQSVNSAEQASRSLSQQAADVSRSAERQMSERLQRASQTMVENMSVLSRDMEASFSRRLAQASRSAVALSQGRVVPNDDDGEGGNGRGGLLETGGFGIPTATGQPAQVVQGMRTEVVVGAVVGGVLGSVVLSVVGVFFGLKIRQRQQRMGRLGPGVGSDTFFTGGGGGGGGDKGMGNRGGSPNIGNPVLQSTSNKAYASVGLGPNGIGGGDKEKDMGGGKRMSDASSVYSSDFEDDDEKGLLKQQQQQQPSPATLARNAPDLRRMVLERSGTTISRKSVGGGQQKVGFAMSYYSPDSTVLPPPPRAVGTGAMKKAAAAGGDNDNDNSVMTGKLKVMTPTATTIVKMGGNKTRQMMKGFQLGQPPPGKLSLFPRSDGGTSSGGSSPVDSEDGKGTPKRLESWLRRERGVVSPFVVAAPGGK
ncbi:hypothetical protein QBC41DRAFT_378287 [Cercophora samala]|uniref:Uncharacterized protein n=1 Tax=Cercophora samala TaxID=330535 RepID=A0AA39ZNS5_9PEZI|nr:hypothetical protein QBC41DRAFT_378287 [Cercophora samala]